MQRHTNIFQINDFHIDYEIIGDGRPLILIHGFGLDKRMWDDQLIICYNNFQIIRYDARGFGQSSNPSMPYAHTDDLKMLLDHLKITQANVVGLSMGGRIALDFAIRYPDRIRSLVIADAVPSGFPRTNERASLSQTLLDTAKKLGISEARKLWLEHSLFQNARKSNVFMDKLREIVEGYSGWHWLNDDPLLETVNGFKEADKVKKHVLLLVGEHDLYDYKSAAKFMKESITNSTSVTISGAGHMSNMENPEQFNEVLLNFLNSQNR